MVSNTLRENSVARVLQLVPSVERECSIKARAHTVKTPSVPVCC
jgi:hypothetical protein